MIRHTSGKALKFSTFLVGDVEYTPDAGNVTLRLLDTSGGVVASVVQSSGSLPIEIDSSHLTLGASVTWDFFMIEAEFEAEGQQHLYQSPLRLQKSVFIYVSPDSVRSTIGASFEELPDEDIDLYDSYVQLTEELEQDIFDSAVASVADANKMVLLHQCMAQMGSLPLKILQKQEVDDHKRTRFSNPNWLGLQESLMAKLSALKTSVVSSSALPQDPLVTVVSRTDIITGA